MYNRFIKEDDQVYKKKYKIYKIKFLNKTKV